MPAILSPSMYEFFSLARH